MQEAIARLRMIFETQGADAAVAEMKKLETAEISLGTSSLNLDRAFTGLERRYSETARATADYERAMRTLNSAVAQNPALAERAAAVQQTIVARYQATMQAAQQAAQAHTAYGLAAQQSAVLGSTLANSTGLLGAAFQTLGRGGVAAAVGVGGLYLAYQKLDEGVTKTAQYARDTQHFAEATGLTTAQVQGLNKEAARFGISADDLHAGLLRFTSGFEEARDGAGTMLEMIRKISPELGQLTLTAANQEEALNIVTEALRRATNEFDRARLARAAFRNIGLLPMMQQLDIGAVTERYQSRGLGQEQIAQLEKLQAEVDAMQTSLQNKVFGAIGAKFLEAKKWGLEVDEAIIKWFGSLINGSKEGQESLEQLYGTQAKLLEQIQKMQEQSENYKGSKLEQEWAAQIQRKIDELKKIEDQISTKMGQRTPAGTATTTGQETQQAQLAQLQALNGILGNLASVEDQVAQKALEIARAYDKVGPEGKAKIDELRNSLLALKTVQAEMSQVAPGTYERQGEALNKIKEAYPGLVAQDAVRMRSLDQQLRIAQAMPGVARMEAEQRVRIQQLTDEGKTAEVAIAMAAKERAVVQAQINTAAQQQLVNLRNQAGVAAAMTGADRIRAQELATINSLLQQGVDLETAQKIAAQERANAEAAVNANIERQVISLQESTQLIRAQIQDMQEQAGTGQKILGIHEMMVRTQQAYTQALREGADAEHAGAIAAATWNNLVAQRAMQQAQAAQAANAQARQAQQQADDQANQEAAQTQQAINQRMSSAQAASQQALGEQIRSLAQAGSNLARQMLGELEGPYGAAWLWNAPQMGSFIDAAKQEVAGIPRQQREQQAVDQLKSLQDEFRLGGAANDQAKAQIQAQLTYEKLIKEGVSASVAQQIANQELANTMQELAKSVDANTTALQSQLDPIYTEGRAALRIGYYGEGSGGTQRIVTGTGYANENAPPANAQTSGNNLIVINNNFAAGAVMGDRRTQYQAANAYGRAIAATGK